MNGNLRLGGLRFEIRKSPRRRTFALTVDRDGALVAHAPADARRDELARWIRGKLLWVHRKLAFREHLVPAASPLAFVSGENISYFGRNHRLAVVDHQPSSLEFDGDRFRLRRADKGRAVALFRTWYIRTGKDWLPTRLKKWGRALGVAPLRVSVRDLGYRWGSCGRDSTLYFNWRLFQLPVPLVDYILVHELAHLREPRHSTRFWRVLDSALPDWQRRREELARTAPRYLTFARAEPSPARRSRR